MLALCPADGVARCLALVWGVTPLVVEPYTGADQAREIARAACRRTGLAKDGERIVIIGGFPVGVAGGTNVITTTTV